MKASRSEFLPLAGILIAVVIAATAFLSLASQVEMARMRNDIRSLEGEVSNYAKERRAMKGEMTVLRGELDAYRTRLEAALREMGGLRLRLAGGAGNSTQPPEPTKPLGTTVEFTLATKTVQTKPRMVFRFIGLGGVIDGKENPPLIVRVGDIVKVALVNQDEDTEHDFVIDELKARSAAVQYQGEKVTVMFKAEVAGEFSYFCSVPGHRKGGMEGKIIVEAK